MTPLLGPKTSSTPVGDAPAGDNKATQATYFQVFTRHETRDTALAGREAQAGANSEVFTNHETRDAKHGFFQARNTAFRATVLSNRCLLVLKPFKSFFRPGGRFRLKVMMPLLGTKTPSAPVGAKSGGDRRAARSPLSCALWSGMARLWRGMGGRRPPRRQHGLLVIHRRQIFLLERTRPCPTMATSRRATRTRITAFLVLKPFSRKTAFFGRGTV